MGSNGSRACARRSAARLSPLPAAGRRTRRNAPRELCSQEGEGSAWAALVAGRRSMVAVQIYTAHKKNNRAKEQAERSTLHCVFRSYTALPYSEPVLWAGCLAAAPDINV